MVNQFVAAAKNQSNKTVTENKAPAFKSTLDTNLDFFAKSGNINFPVLSVFKQAFAEDRDLAIRNLLHMRDVRNGKGIRDNSIPYQLNDMLESLFTEFTHFHLG